jgi:hypothetical protein
LQAATKTNPCSLISKHGPAKAGLCLASARIDKFISTIVPERPHHEGYEGPEGTATSLLFVFLVAFVVKPSLRRAGIASARYHPRLALRRVNICSKWVFD